MVCVVMEGRCGVWEGVVVCVEMGGRCGLWEEGGRVCVVNFTCRPRIKSHCNQQIRAVKM